jgi:hypothetical protein
MSEKTNDVQVEDLVTLYGDNGEAPRSECYTFTIGVYKDEYYHMDDDNAYRLQSGEICHREDDDDDIHETVCGDRFHSDEQEELEIVWLDVDDCYAYSCNCTYGYVTFHYEGYFLDDNDYVECDGQYYINERIANYHNVYYYDSVGEYRHVDDAPDDDCEDEEEHEPINVYDDPDNRDYVHSYHTNPDRRWRVDKTTEWTFGCEVEKEDYDVKHSCYANQLPHYWTKERDGSLDDKSGYELISPVYDLFGTLHEEDIKSSDSLQNHINASHSRKCGGHIHLGSTKHSTSELFHGIEGFLPMLYSIYEHRTTSTYCAAKKKHEYLRRDKFSAVYVRSNTLEFRIFPAVKSVENLKWRIELIRIMVKNFKATEREVLAMLCDSNSDLHKHLANAVGNDKMMRKVSMFVNYSSLFNDIDLSGDNQEIK